MRILDQYGLNEYLKSAGRQEEGSQIGSMARVVSLQGFRYGLVTDEGDIDAELSGRLLYGSKAESLPKVGDWVRFVGYGQMGYIVESLPRINALTRKEPGNPAGVQVLAANIDKAIIVQGLDRDFNVMRIDRYVVQLLACSIPSVILLNKSDLIGDREPFLGMIAALGRQVPVYFCSTLTPGGLTGWTSEVLLPGKTYILIGSSGVGKSSILNSIVSADLQAISPVSESTSKGRHTTTVRELFRLPDGSLMIDTPGMREFGIAADGGELPADMFPAIQQYAAHCRFDDCRHLDEEGCAVKEAFNSGNLDPYAYESYMKLIKEQRRFEISAEEKKRLGKQFGKMSREAKAYRSKYKY